MQITLEVPDNSLSITRETPAEFARSMRIAAAVKWYELGRISQSKAAELIGCNRVELFNHLRDYGVPFFQVSAADLDAELADNHAHASRKAADLRNNAIRVGKLLSGLIASTRRHQIGKATGLILALVIPATYAFSHWLD